MTANENNSTSLPHLLVKWDPGPKAVIDSCRDGNRHSKPGPSHATKTSETRRALISKAGSHAWLHTIYKQNGYYLFCKRRILPEAVNHRVKNAPQSKSKERRRLWIRQPTSPSESERNSLTVNPLGLFPLRGRFYSMVSCGLCGIGFETRNGNHTGRVLLYGFVWAVWDWLWNPKRKWHWPEVFERVCV